MRYSLVVSAIIGFGIAGVFLGYGLGSTVNSKLDPIQISSSSNCLPSDCSISRSGATLLCKKYDPKGGVGALVELHPDFQEDGIVCYFTRGNRELCNLDEIGSLERRIFGRNAPPDARFVQEVAGLGVNF